MSLRYASNRLLALLPDSDLRCLEPYLEPVSLPSGGILAEPDAPQEFIFFPTAGVVSVMTAMPDSRGLEVGIYGRDGAGPMSIALGVDRILYRHFVQIEGTAWRIPTQVFAEILESNSAVRALALRYVHVFSTQTSYTAMSNGIASVEVRLARWLLMCHDRLEGDDIGLTHELLSLILGVRRPGVTTAMQSLEGMHILRNTRGKIRVLNRAFLKEAAGDSYGVPEAEYHRLIGPRL